MERIKNLTLVDDDDVFVYLTKKTIKQTNLVDLVKVFGNGLDAINFLKENKGNAEVLPEVMFLDLSMPIMDGWQFLDEFQKLYHLLPKKITIYICSSSISPEDIALAKSISQVSEFIIKPIHKEKLIDIIKNL
ncbi:MAG: response regulator [Lunatimonas sp.]|uniref:response regulator n=1 Tax=Lunatimonas sp. TaxID=2060141 RepID=UPI00263A678B|nr:response regulator [Lunatimonas sp.]MCC5937076.1 response regulator [Lunatimonas sp.]